MTGPGLRELARRLPAFERRRRRLTVEAATSVQILHAVIPAGVSEGVWRNNTDAARDVFGIEERRFRRMNTGEEEIPPAMRDKLIVYAFAFGLEIKPE